MASSNLPGTNAARHATGNIDLTAMMVAHEAFRRDMVKLARKANRSNIADPVQRLAITNGWAVFKRQLLQHHENEDACLWPPLRERQANNAFAMSTLDAMEAEHGLIDPLLAAVDQHLTDEQATEERLADVIDELVSNLTGHLAHEERDTLPLIGETLTVEEWAEIGNKIRARGTVEDAMEMVPWMLDEASPETVAATLATFPPVVQQMYHRAWKPSYDAVPHW